jgi:short chain dehydrogenase
MTTFDFGGRVAVVTGAGRGIGRACVLLLGQRGAKVVVNDLGGSTKGTGHDPAPAQEVADQITKAGGTAIADSGDVSTVEGGKQAVDAAVNEWGRVDIVVNNAEPELVAPMAAFLAHASCPVSAGIYLAGGGRGSPGCSSPPPTATCTRTTSRRRSRTSPPTGRRSTTRPATTCQPAR